MPESVYDALIERDNPVMIKKTFARRFCPSGVWSQLQVDDNPEDVRLQALPGATQPKQVRGLRFSKI